MGVLCVTLAPLGLINDVFDSFAVDNCDRPIVDEDSTFCKYLPPLKAIALPTTAYCRLKWVVTLPSVQVESR